MSRLGRFVRGAVVAACGLVPAAPAWADEPVTVVVSATEGPEPEALGHALAAAELVADRTLDGSVLGQRVRVVSVTRRAADEDCGGTVDLGDWRGRTDAARDELNRLKFDQALADLVNLELQTACLTSAPAASDLFRVELLVAEAHRLLADGGDADQHDFHEGEMQGALARAAVFGTGLASPPDASPEVLAALDEVRAGLEEEKAPRVVVASPTGLAGVRINGRPVPVGRFDGVPGTNLVQATVAGTVTAAASVELTPGKPTLLWLAPGERAQPADVLTRDVDALGAGPVDDGAAVRLAGAAALLPNPSHVIYAGRDHGRVALYRAKNGTLVRVDAAVAAAPPVAQAAAPWTWCVGFGVGGGVATLTDETLPDVGGGRFVTSVYGRATLSGPWLLAVSAEPDLVWRPLAPAEGHGSLYHVTLPVRAGVRYGTRGDGWSWEVGLDLGAHFYGDFDGEARWSPIATVSGGGARGFGPKVGLRLGGWVGGGLGYALVGATLGVEARR